MIAKELLDILVCPETKQGLTLASSELLLELNSRVQAGVLKNRGALQITEPFEGVLVREDGKWGYGIRKGIPVMLVEEAFPLNG